MGIRNLLRRSPLYEPYLRSKYRFATGARESLFTGFYRDNIWSDPESRSGAGSSMADTKTLRRELPALLRRLGVRTFLDVPCGDFAWMQHVDLDGIDYTGGDIVTELVEDLQARYGGEHRRFVRLDIISETPPEVDAIMVRDLLLHLPNDLAVRAIRAAGMRTGIRWVLLSHYTDPTENPDIRLGGHRFPNLTLPPFNLPPPAHLIAEDPTSDGRSDKTLAVWSCDTIRDVAVSQRGLF